MIDPGLYAKVTFLRDAADTKEALMTGNTVAVTWLARRELRPEVTPLNSNFLHYAPDAQTGILKLTGFIDRSVSPGELNEIEATVTFQPNSNEASRYILFPAWVQEYSWISVVDDANRFSAVIVPTGEATYAW